MIGDLVGYKGIAGRVLDETTERSHGGEQKRILWIITPECWYVGVPADSEHLERLDSLPEADPELTKTARQERRDARREKKLARKAELEAKKVKSSIAKTTEVPGAGWVDFRGSQSLPAGSYKVVAGPFSSRNLGKGHVKDEAKHKCIKMAEGVYFVVLVK